jgi:hypothetical protein
MSYLQKKTLKPAKKMPGPAIMATIIVQLGGTAGAPDYLAQRREKTKFSEWTS